MHTEFRSYWLHIVAVITNERRKLLTGVYGYLCTRLASTFFDFCFLSATVSQCMSESMNDFNKSFIFFFFGGGRGNEWIMYLAKEVSYGISFMRRMCLSRLLYFLQSGLSVLPEPDTLMLASSVWPAVIPFLYCG